MVITNTHEIPLRVAHGCSELTVENKLISCISEQIGDCKIDVAILEPLVTLHGVPGV
jgi:hypothetical protein